MLNNRLVSYTYVDSEILRNKYMNEIPLPSKIKRRLCRKIAEVIDQVINKQKNIDELSNVFILLESDSTTIRLCINATRNYLNSSYFDYPDKYKTRSWLWDQVKYVSENVWNPTITLFNETLDSLANEYEENAEPTCIKENEEKPVDANHASKYMETFSLSRIGIAMLFILSHLTRGANAQSHQMQYPINNLNPLPINTFMLTRDSAFDLLPTYYDIYTNTALKDARLFLFLESYNNVTHHQLLSTFVPAIGDVRDLVLLEGVESMSEISCQNLCIVERNGADAIYNTSHEKEYVKEVSTIQSSVNANGEISFVSNCIQNLGFGRFKCLGADDKSLVTPALDELTLANKYISEAKSHSEHQGKFGKDSNSILSKVTDFLNCVRNEKYVELVDHVSNIYKEAVNLNKFYPNLISKESLVQLKKSIKEYKSSLENSNNIMSYFFSYAPDSKIVEQFYNFIDEMVESLKSVQSNLKKRSGDIVKSKPNLSHLNDSNQLIKGRNKKFISTLENPVVKNHSGRIIGLWGMFHGITGREEVDSQNGNSRFDVNPEDLQYELRNYLDDNYPHAILVPKN